MVVTTALSFLLLVVQPSLIEQLEARTWDWRVGVVAPTFSPDPRIAIISIDQKSLDLMAEEQRLFWVWPRDIYEALLEYLKLARASAVGFDILFTEPSPYGVAGDQRFGESMRGELPVVLAAKARTTEREFFPESTARFFEIHRAFAPELVPRLQSFTPPVAPSIVAPIEPLMVAPPTLGNVGGEPDRDGVFRHHRPAVMIGDAPLLSLPFELFRRGGGDIAWEELRLDARQGLLGVRFKGRPLGHPSSYRGYSLYSIIQSYLAIQGGEAPLVSPTEFENSFVFIGMTAPGLLDLRPTPLGPTTAGVEYHAAVLDNLLNRDFARYPALAVVIGAIGLILTLVVGGALSARRARVQLLLIGILLLVTIGSSLWGAFGGWWLPMVVPCLAVVFAGVLATALQYAVEGREHRFIKGAFQHYVSPEVIDQIVEDPRHLSLGGARRELTIFFSDLEGFTSISEKLPASALAELLNEFLSAMTDEILAHGGTVDKYIGDAIVAFWNAPLNQPDHARRGFDAMVACNTRAREMAPELERRFGVKVRMRIGLNSGEINVGNFGSRARFNYTVLGDAANLASRLEGANKAFGTTMLVSHATVEQAGYFERVRKIGALIVVGKKEPVVVYEPLLGKGVVDMRYVQALAAFEQGNWEEARALFEELTNDSVAQAYVRRIQRGGERRSYWELHEK